jgi:GNAT superfamily N-acetyltransferase
MIAVKHAQTDEQIRACFPAMLELRPHLKSAEDFLARIRRQTEEGYKLLYVEDDGAPAACAGFRITEHLYWGRALYVDDLICREGLRGRGHATALMDWMEDHARTEGCEQFHLDSGCQRLVAHRFYHGRKLAITSFHFVKRLGQD